MRLNEYQLAVERTAKFPGANASGSLDGLANVILGLCKEAEGLGRQVQRILDSGVVITLDDRSVLTQGLAECAWYVAQLATQLGYDLDWIVSDHLKQLASSDR